MKPISSHSSKRRLAEALEPRLLFANLTIAQENALTGAPPSQWDIVGAGDSTIQGFATDISVNRGATIEFKINDTALAAYHLDIYRMGFYQGNGARLVTTISSAQTLAVSQPAPLTVPATGLIDCGNWSVTASWSVPADATSGIYFAKVIRNDTNGASHIVFIVRNDSSHSDVLFQTSDETWQAYNTWGGNSLYIGSPVDRAYAVSYNRPFNTREDTPQDWVFSAEYPMVRFLEANGYDLSYSTGIDATRNGSLIANHKLYLSVGHDEYWSGPQRANVEAAVAAGVNLGFFSGNEVYWKTRFEQSIDPAHTNYRTMVCYKESTDDQAPGTILTLPDGVKAGYNLNGIADPSSTWTGLWRDTRFTTDAKVEQTLTGQLWSVNRGANGLFGTAIKVPAEFASARIWRSTSIANLQPGQTATLSQGTLGYEWDEDVSSPFRPAGTIALSSTTESVEEKLLDPLSWPGCGGTSGALCSRCRGCMVSTGTATHSLTEHRDSTSNALIFNAGTIQWSWGLDSNHDGGTTVADLRMQQATVNILADMDAMPATLIANLVAASKSTDHAGPSSSIAPLQNNVLTPNDGFATLTGTSADVGGGVVMGVEISTDGGATWNKATGRESWTYTWAPTLFGATSIKVRSSDDSANLGTVVSGNINLVQGAPTITLWSSATKPGTENDDDQDAVEVGMKFRSDAAGSITAIRFYKGDQNIGTHVGHLWSSTGSLLASVTFGNESATGWQSATLSNPVAISADTTYIVSYHCEFGHYSSDSGYFVAAGINHGPLHALGNGVEGSNGVYFYGGFGFPTSTHRSANYWVDLTFNDTIAPTLSSKTPGAGASGVSRSTKINVTFAEPVQIDSFVFSLKDSQNHTVVSNVTFDLTGRIATIVPRGPLVPTTYTATVSTAKDLLGNAMVAPVTWSFNVGLLPGPIQTQPQKQSSEGADNNYTLIFFDDDSTQTIVHELSKKRI